MAKTGKRSSGAGKQEHLKLTQGVGGRQARRDTPCGGGGYLDDCSDSGPPLGGHEKKPRAPEGFAGDERIQELREAGLPTRWLEVAEAIGFDAFMRMWVILDRENLETEGQRENLRIWIPQVACYLRYQRNCFIRSLAEAGLTSEEIREQLRRELGEDMSERNIIRIRGATSN